MNDASERHYGRAAFIALLGGGGSALWWGAKASGIFSPLTSSVSQLVGNLFPVGGWRIYTISGSMPEFDPKTWRLEIDGLVAKPRSFTYEELRTLPRAHQVSDFHCVTGWTVHGVRWSGVRFAHLLDQVEPLPEAKAIVAIVFSCWPRFILPLGSRRSSSRKVRRSERLSPTRRTSASAPAQAAAV